MKQVLFLLTLAEDKRYTFLHILIVLTKSLGTLMAFYTLMVWVFRRLLANIVELKQFYISFKTFSDSASASAYS